MLELAKFEQEQDMLILQNRYNIRQCVITFDNIELGLPRRVLSL